MSKQFRRITEKGFEFIKAQEGLRLESYRDTGGVWTCGYGSTGPDIGPTTRWLESKAEERLQADLRRFEQGVADALDVQVSDCQFDALVSLAYNVGLSALNKSTLLKYLNNGEPNKAAQEFLKWCKDDGRVIAGLYRRREREMSLFLS